MGEVMSSTWRPFVLRAGGSGRFTLVDHVACWLLVFLAAALAYHPYFFGDEIAPLVDVRATDGFLEALRTISQYKPRLIFNAVWALGGELGWARWGFAAVSAAAMAATCSLAATLASSYGSATRLQAWLLVACIAGSRFAAMLYFDYVSGIIETLSIALFLVAVVLGCRAAGSDRIGAWLGCICVAVATVLVHERFMAATTALAVALALHMAIFERRRRPWWTWPMLGLLAALPPVLFLWLIEAFNSLPASTGTAGSAVNINGRTPIVFITYVGNAFFGLNFGQDWFVGRLNMGRPGGWWLSCAYAVALGCAWAAWAWSIRRNRKSLGAALGLLMVAGGLLVMASLPGEGRQEARWLFPVGIIVALLYFASPSNRVRLVLLSLSLSLSVIHWASGALWSTANIYESRTARNLAELVNGSPPGGHRAALIGMGESHAAAWSVGEFQGASEFARLNFRVPLDMEVHRTGVPLGDVDVGFLRSGTDSQGAGEFSLLYGRDLEVMLHPESLESWRRPGSEVEVLGSGLEWQDWKWSARPRFSDDALVLGPLEDFTGFIERPAAVLSSHGLAYRARAANPGGKARMRLQVNWMDAGDRFINASIVVVDVGDAYANYEMPLAPPAGAAKGLVYAGLHDGERGPVLLESVSTRSAAVTSLGAGAAWPEWRWSGHAVIGADGVLLPAAERVSGFLPLETNRIDDHILVYRARALTVGAAPILRLQVNWQGADGRFIGASIQTAELGREMRNYPVLVRAPAGAVVGEVYANLHDGEMGDALLESVVLLSREARQ